MVSPLGLVVPERAPHGTPELGLLLCSQFLPDQDPVEAFDGQLDQVRLVRKAGFGGVFASQHYLAHPLQYLHPLAVLARLIPELGHMRLGTAIHLLALPSPVDVAEQLATIDILSGGRLTVGVGLGYRDEEFAAFGLGTQGRLRRYLDNLDLLRVLWTQEQVSFESEHARLDKVPIALKPVQRPHPPIWMAAHTDQAIRRAARRGLPWVVAAAHVDDAHLAHQLSVWRDACREFGQEDMDLPVLQEIYVAPTEDEALAAVRQSLQVKYQTYRSWGQDAILPDDQSFDKDFDELRQGRFIIGDPQQCINRIRDLLETARPTHLLLRMQWPGMSHETTQASMELFFTQVMPHLQLTLRKETS